MDGKADNLGKWHCTVWQGERGQRKKVGQTFLCSFSHAEKIFQTRRKIFQAIFSIFVSSYFGQLLYVPPSLSLRVYFFQGCFWYFFELQRMWEVIVVSQKIRTGKKCLYQRTNAQWTSKWKKASNPRPKEFNEGKEKLWMRQTDQQKNERKWVCQEKLNSYAKFPFFFFFQSVFYGTTWCELLLRMRRTHGSRGGKIMKGRKIMT